MARVSYHSTADRPALELWLLDDDDTLIDFSSGYTFSFEIGTPGTTALLTTTTGVTGAAGAGTEPTGTPNIVVTWTAGQHALAVGTYVGQLTATTGGLDRVFAFPFSITDVVT